VVVARGRADLALRASAAFAIRGAE